MVSSFSDAVCPVWINYHNLHYSVYTLCQCTVRCKAYASIMINNTLCIIINYAFLHEAEQYSVWKEVYRLWRFRYSRLGLQYGLVSLLSPSPPFLSHLRFGFQSFARACVRVVHSSMASPSTAANFFSPETSVTIPPSLFIHYGLLHRLLANSDKLYLLCAVLFSYDWFANIKKLVIEWCSSIANVSMSANARPTHLSC